VPKGTQDRGNKLDDIYIKFLLPYDTLSEVERNELLRLVEEEFDERNKKKLDRSKNEEKDDSEDEEEEEDEVSPAVRAVKLFTVVIKYERDCHLRENERGGTGGNEKISWTRLY
jgi:hypothetical protein